MSKLVNYPFTGGVSLNVNCNLSTFVRILNVFKRNRFLLNLRNEVIA